jgi:hypothetical protein
MARNILSEESYADLRFPEKWVDLARGFGQQLPGTTRDWQNVLAFEQTRLRNRSGSAPGLVRFIDEQLPQTHGNLSPNMAGLRGHGRSRSGFPKFFF